MDDLAEQAIDHIYAAIVWIIRYVEKNHLPIADDPTFPSFKHHLLRLNAILKTLEYPIPNSPVISDGFIRPKPSDDNSTEPLRVCGLFSIDLIGLRLLP
jgi:hypothetical protein